jgi:hypothetical protein
MIVILTDSFGMSNHYSFKLTVKKRTEDEKYEELLKKLILAKNPITIIPES